MKNLKAKIQIALLKLQFKAFGGLITIEENKGDYSTARFYPYNWKAILPKPLKQRKYYMGTHKFIGINIGRGAIISTASDLTRLL